jgi:aspartate/methionine/tyrosine aminotransferase
MLAIVKLCNASNLNSRYTKFLYEKALEPAILEDVVRVFNERFVKAKEIVRRSHENVTVFEKSVFAKLDVTAFIKTIGEEEEFVKQLLNNYRVWVVPA